MISSGTKAYWVGVLTDLHVGAFNLETGAFIFRHKAEGYDYGIGGISATRIIDADSSALNVY